jgi:hypothetical protein
MERPAARRELPLLLELSGLCGLAVTLPALDVLGRSPDFLVLEGGGGLRRLPLRAG